MKLLGASFSLNADKKNSTKIQLQTGTAKPEKLHKLCVTKRQAFLSLNLEGGVLNKKKWRNIFHIENPKTF